MEHKLKFPHRFSRSGALSALGFLLALAALLAYPETVRQSVAQSIVYCLTALTSRPLPCSPTWPWPASRCAPQPQPF